MNVKSLQLVTNMILINTCFNQDNCNQCKYTSGNRCDLTNKSSIIEKVQQYFCNKYSSCITCIAWHNMVSRCYCGFDIWYIMYKQYNKGMGL